MLSTKLFLMVLTVLLCCLTLTVRAESGEGGNHTEEQEDCQDYDMYWFIHQYDLRILTKPYLNIGVNISLKDAAKTKHWEFKKLIRNAHLTQLHPKNICKYGIPQHSQQMQQACSWNYTCDYNPHRFPAYIFHARCTNTHWLQYNPTGFPPLKPKSCRSIYYPVPVLYSQGCNPLTSKKNWEWKQEMVSVACA